MSEKLAVGIFGIVLVIAWLIDYCNFRGERERLRRMRATGKNQWWKDSAGDDGDY